MSQRIWEEGIGILSSDLVAVVLQRVEPSSLLLCCCVCRSLRKIVEGSGQPEAGCLLRSLRVLNLRSAELYQHNLERVLSRFPCLEVLDLSRCSLHTTDTEAAFSAALMGCKSLTTLNLSDAHLVAPATFGSHLPASLLQLDASGFRDPSPEGLLNGIKQHPRLRAVRISRRAAGEIDVLISELKSSSLELLDVGMCYEQRGVMATSVEQMAVSCRALRCLDLSMVLRSPIPSSPYFDSILALLFDSPPSPSSPTASFMPSPHHPFSPSSALIPTHRRSSMIKAMIKANPSLIFPCTPRSCFTWTATPSSPPLNNPLLTSLLTTPP
jgi:hypothetical protein